MLVMGGMTIWEGMSNYVLIPTDMETKETEELSECKCQSDVTSLYD
jgi:hypothetical protein